MDKNAEQIIKRFTKAQSRKANWAELYEDAQSYVAPQRESFDDDVEINPGEHKDGTGIVYDSTGIDATLKFASNLQSSLVPPMRQWVEFKPGAQLQDDKELKIQLEGIGNTIFGGIANSNFDTAIAESFQDLAIGTGALLVFKGTPSKPFRFVSVPLNQIFIEEGPNGLTETVYRKWRIAVRNIEKTWPDAVLSKDLTDLLSENPDAKVEIIEEITPAEIDFTDAQGTRTIEGFKYTVLEMNGKKTMVEREQRSSPWVIFRWSVLAGETYGRGPVLTALPDIKTLNKTKELLLKSASIAIFGMWTGVDDGLVNLENISFKPATIIPVSSNPGSPQGPTLSPLQPPGDPNLAQIIIENLRGSINNMLFADPLGPIDLPVKSATEMSLRQQELAKRIGSAFGRLQFELIQPLMNRLLDIADDLGLIELGDFRVDGNIIAIEHVSPLAQAQGEEEFLSTLRFMETIVGMYGPEALHMAVPLDKFVSLTAPKLNIPAAMVPSQEEFDIMKQQAAEMAQQQVEQGGEMPVE